jgi:hypothetical protein
MIGPLTCKCCLVFVGLNLNGQAFKEPLLFLRHPSVWLSSNDFKKELFFWKWELERWEGLLLRIKTEIPTEDMIWKEFTLLCSEKIVELKSRVRTLEGYPLAIPLLMGSPSENEVRSFQRVLPATKKAKRIIGSEWLAMHCSLEKKKAEIIKMEEKLIEQEVAKTRQSKILFTEYLRMELRQKIVLDEVRMIKFEKQLQRAKLDLDKP